MKRVTRTRITVETREVLVVRGERLQGRCAQCGQQVDMIRLHVIDDRREAGRDGAAPHNPHLIESGDGGRFLCLNSWLNCF